MGSSAPATHLSTPARLIATLTTVLLVVSSLVSQETHASPSASGSVTTDRQLISTKQGWLIDEGGRVRIFHGFNVHQKVKPYTPSSMNFDRRDALFLSRNGFNVVRLGFQWAALEPRIGQYEQNYLNSIEETVNMLGDFGIRTILDFHQDNYNEQFVNIWKGQGFPDWAVLDSKGSTDSTRAYNAFLANKKVRGIGLQDRFAKMWQTVAQYFSSNSSVLGYELMNEPHPGSMSPSRIQHKRKLDRNDLPIDHPIRDVWTKAIRAIRTVDSHHLIFWGHLNLDPTNPLAPLIKATPRGISLDDGLVFSSHPYCAFTAYVPLVSQKLRHQQWKITDTVCPFIESQFASLLEHSTQSRKYPAFLTEFGSTSNPVELRRMADYADQAQLSWTEWTYHRTGKSDFPGTPSIIKDLNRPRSGSNINREVLDPLVRPFPSAIAGTPKSWKYSSSQRRFTLRYSTRQVSGHGRTADNRTVVSVPSKVAANGYSVSVRGGHVVSPSDSPEVIIIADRNATEVNVVLTHKK